MNRLALFIASIILLFHVVPSRAEGDVKLGIDVLKESRMEGLKGKKVGLITNHTGLDRDGNSTIDLLHQNEDVQLVRLFCPEHGLRGVMDEKVEDGVDPITGLKVVSLYGKNRKPKIEDLQDLDLLLFDIQDIGCRFYTYISTMANAMIASKEAGIEMWILDRPNPIGGVIVSGFLIPDSLAGAFTAIYSIPTRHGMTVGELALMFNEEEDIHCQLNVIKVENWKRDMFWDETGLAWVNPSPNMKTLTGAIAYPGLGWLETTALSMGRGTSIPFEIYGAPYIDAEEFVGKIKDRDLPGGRVVPFRFVPSQKYHKFKDEECQGFQVVIFDKKKFDAFGFGLHVFQTLYEMYPEDYTWKDGMKVSLGNGDFGPMIKEGKDMKKLVEKNAKDLEGFMKIRDEYLLY